MNQVHRISGYLPPTTNSAEQLAAIEFTSIVNDIVTAHSGTASNFSFSKGVANVEVSGDDAVKAVTEAFTSVDGVKVETLSAILASRLLNIKRQEKTERMRATKERKKGAQ